MRLKRYQWTLLIFVIVIIDQLVKKAVVANLSQVDSITVIPHILSFVYVENTGAAFSIFSDKTAVLGIISILFCIAVTGYWLIKRPQNKLLEFSLSLLLAGALGNAIDRILRGFVIDFIETNFIKFPVFNIADISITFGTVFLMVYLLFFDKDGNKNGENSN